MQPCFVRIASSDCPDGRAATASIARELASGAPSPQVLVAFASPAYDLQTLFAELRASFPQAVLAGCTTSGQLSPAGFQRGGLTVAALGGPEVEAERYTLDLQDVSSEACRVGALVRARRTLLRPGWRSFGLLLVDGLSLSEERLAASLYAALDSVPIVGGSAGDDLRFESTYVLTEEGFREGFASLVVVHTTAPFEAFKAQHFVATDTRLVVTRADPVRRIVYELDGEPAIEAYTRAIGATTGQLGPELYSLHPVMLRLQGEDYIRSIQRAGTDGSLAFLCAIDEGLVLRVGRAADPLGCLRGRFAELSARLGPLEAVLGCDCILRRLELERSGLDQEVGRFLAEHRVVGFSTYGEQLNAVHVNQTFTGIAIGTGP